MSPMDLVRCVDAGQYDARPVFLREGRVYRVKELWPAEFQHGDCVRCHTRHPGVELFGQRDVAICYCPGRFAEVDEGAVDHKRTEEIIRRLEETPVLEGYVDGAFRPGLVADRHGDERLRLRRLPGHRRGVGVAVEGAEAPDGDILI